MGLRDHSYGPEVISFGGGFTGTGVPLVLKKQIAGYAVIAIPRNITGAPKKKFKGGGGMIGRFIFLSIKMEMAIKVIIMPR